MILKTLTLRQFRSHGDLQLNVDPKVNLFLGANGSGKTNLIESIAVLTTGLSPRGADNESMVGWGDTGYAILGDFVNEADGTSKMSLEMKYVKGSRRIRQDGETSIRLKDLIGRVPLVSFIPDDLLMVKGEPELRRRAVNMVLVQVDPVYSEALRRYNEALRARNAALKQLAEGRLSLEDLDPWDDALVQAGVIVCRKRARFIDLFSVRVSEIQERISGGVDSVQLEYKPSFQNFDGETAEETWLNYLRNVRPREMAAGVTLSGPHRDDLVFKLDGRLAKTCASEGQMRTCAVSFKLAEVPYILEKRGQKPLCLLDDVLSELDVDRAQHLLDELTRTGQCFVTMTGLESWPDHRALPAAVFKIDKDGVLPTSPVKDERYVSAV